MSLKFDPEKNEINHLLDFAGNLGRQRVLEIGAGVGRLTWRYAALAREVIAIDPNPERVTKAQADLPKDLQERVRFLETSIADYHLDPKEAPFDLALMSWSL
jgi:predicted RNA methylase